MIRYEHIHLEYNRKVLLKDFNLEIRKGEKLLIAGKSGIGKTSLFRLLLGFAKSRKGQVFFDNKQVDSNMAWEIRKRTGYVPQGADIGGGRVSDVIHDICSFKTNRHLVQENEKRDEILDFLELDRGILDEEMETLSGGEKQRISLLIVLLLNRNLFLLDEATASLDADLKKKVARYFMDQKNWTVLSISHDPCWRETGAMTIVNMEASYGP